MLEIVQVEFGDLLIGAIRRKGASGMTPGFMTYRTR